MLIQWFPGHMAKTKRLIEEHLKSVDVAAELLDARIPFSGANPMVEELIGTKARIVILNKADLADPVMTKKWEEYFRKKGASVVSISCKDGKDRKKLLRIFREAALPVLTKWKSRGFKARSARVMILGIPNVGKSTLINFMAGAAMTRTANTPGHTRGKQWVKLSDGLDLLDTPGVLWPKFEDQEAALRLAATGAIAGDVFDAHSVVISLLDALKKMAPQVLMEKYKLKELSDEVEILLEEIGRRRGCLLPGGVVDFERTETLVLHDFRQGKLGRVTLDKVPEEKE